MAFKDSCAALDAGLIQDGGSAEQPPRRPRKEKEKKKKEEEEKSHKKGTEETHQEGVEKGQAEPPGKEAEIQGLTATGHQALLRGDPKTALGCFKRAFLLSRETPGWQAQGACASNLGAAYVEAGKPEKGLEVLLRSLPGDGEEAEPPGDLFFNLGAAHEGLGDFARALESFRKAQERYQSAQAGREAGASLRMGSCYLAMGDPARAAPCFLEAARAYEEGGSPELAAAALCRAAGLMGQGGGHGTSQAVEVLNRCRQLCTQISDKALLGNLYNDIGLCFSRLKIFSLAAESFERALPLCQNREDAASTSRGQEAAILQNLGAAHNMLGNFDTALGFHRAAAALHSTLGNRRAQGQCFCNTAFAFSQLGDHEAAGENYLHALQAFKDAGDLQGQWQACEGLGGSRFQMGDPEKAISHYKEALALFSQCQDASDPAQERIVNKLTDALQCKLSRIGWDPHASGTTPPAPSRHLPRSQPASQVRFAVSLHRREDCDPPGAGRGSDLSVGPEDHHVHPTQRSTLVSSTSHGALPWRELVAPSITSLKPKYHGASAQSGAREIPNGHAALLGESLEGPEGPSAFPDSHKQAQENSHLNAFPLHPDGFQGGKSCHAPRCQQACGALQLRTGTLQRGGVSPSRFPSRHLEPHQPGWKERLRSIVCALM
ncbi:hypothetical protein JRQ81_009596 [Phrynocephalus forsythii]|uniref:Tetratricopeptide repeat protein 24 n=1 Tax=Phrynocephalus forsythii TaxID=171643 RepID=A0A9Q0XB01_9SAUR|nr:hypothetical protein JRQ81_009596 [Phrynocephalus forsythii]